MYSEQYHNSYALLVGIDEYDDPKLEKLHTAVNGAEALSRLLQDAFEFEVELLRNKDATSGRIISWIEKRANGPNANPNDRLFLYFAGHGFKYTKSGYFMLSDSQRHSPAASAIKMSQIVELTENMTPKHMCISIDACFSGLALPRTRGLQSTVSASSYLRHKAIQVITAGTDDQKVPDALADDNQSLFTWYLLQGLLGKAFERNILTARTLFYYISDQVSQVMGDKLEPQFYQTPETKGDFIFSDFSHIALTEIDRLIEKWYFMGITHFHEQNYEDAVEAFRDVININPNYKDAVDRLARTLDRIQALGPSTSSSFEIISDTPSSEIQLVESGHRSQIEDPTDLILIPGGTFSMGSTETHIRELNFKYNDVWFENTELPQRKIDIPDFFIGKYPVRVAEYQKFIEAGGYLEMQWWTKVGWTWRNDNLITQPSQWNSQYSLQNSESLPVTGVSWHEAYAYCRWLSSLSGKNCSLPTEAQWEKAARGSDDERIYPWGNDKPTYQHANFEDSIGYPTQVGKFSPLGDSPYKCADMSGNVSEWCCTKWVEHAYDISTAQPCDDLDADVSRVIRSSGYHESGVWLRVSTRRSHKPEGRFRFLGFRIVVTIDTE